MAVSTLLAADPGSLCDHATALREGGVEPTEWLQRALVRIDAVEPKIQGWQAIDRASAQAQATSLRASPGDQRGPLFGVPVAIKDVIDVAGLPTRAGSRTRAHQPAAAQDATVVARLRAAGAVILGKAHTTEFAYFDGPPPTRNPYDLARTPGGSSAGPAAVVASGMVPISLGTQTAGSVNRPAAYCGIAAFKPSTLSWPSYGVVPFAPTFDTIGVFGYRTSDATLAARALMPSFIGRPKPVGARPVIVLLDDPILEAATGGVARSIQSAAEKLESAGMAICRARSPVAFDEIIARHKAIMEYELAQAHRALLDAPEGDVTPALIEAIERGRRISDDAYCAALVWLDRARESFFAAVGEGEAIAFPAAPDIAPVGEKTGDPRFIIPFTALGGPIVSIPVDFDRHMPLGLLLAGRPGDDWRLAEVADSAASAIEIAR